jgi:hypothetical protein
MSSSRPIAFSRLPATGPAKVVPGQVTPGRPPKVHRSLSCVHCMATYQEKDRCAGGARDDRIFCGQKSPARRYASFPSLAAKMCGGRGVTLNHPENAVFVRAQQPHPDIEYVRQILYGLLKQQNSNVLSGKPHSRRDWQHSDMRRCTTRHGKSEANPVSNVILITSVLRQSADSVMSVTSLSDE